MVPLESPGITGITGNPETTSAADTQHHLGLEETKLLDGSSSDVTCLMTTVCPGSSAWILEVTDYCLSMVWPSIDAPTYLSTYLTYLPSTTCPRAFIRLPWTLK